MAAFAAEMRSHMTTINTRGYNIYVRHNHDIVKRTDHDPCGGHDFGILVLIARNRYDSDTYGKNDGDGAEKTPRHGEKLMAVRA